MGCGPRRFMILPILLKHDVIRWLEKESCMGSASSDDARLPFQRLIELMEKAPAGIGLYHLREMLAAISALPLFAAGVRVQHVIGGAEVFFSKEAGRHELAFVFRPNLECHRVREEGREIVASWEEGIRCILRELICFEKDLEALATCSARRLNEALNAVPYGERAVSAGRLTLVSA
jgi:hypothetical protein